MALPSRLHRFLASLAAGLVLAGPACAAGHGLVVDGVQVAEQIDQSGHELVLNGVGQRTILGFPVYVAALYLPVRQHSVAEILGHDQPRQVRITLQHEVSTERNLAALKNGLIANNSPAEMVAIDAEVDHFLGLLHQFHVLPAGTVIRFDYLPGKGTRILVGDRELGCIAGERFNLAVLRVWLGNEPIQASLKDALLGLGLSG